MFWNKRNKQSFYEENRHGSARFADARDIRDAGFLENRRNGIFKGFCPYSGKPLYYSGDAPCITIAGSGAGKGRDLLSYSANYDGTLLCLDVKGELAAITADNHRRNGKRVYCINPGGLWRGAPYNLDMHKVNPIDFLTPISQTLTTDCISIAELLITLSSGNSVFFENRGREWLARLLKFRVLTQGPQTLPGFWRWLVRLESQPAEFLTELKDEALTYPSDDIQRTAGEILNKWSSAGNEYSGIVSTLFSALSFLDDLAIQACLSGSDFSLDVITGKPKTAVFLIVPVEKLSQWTGFARLIIGVAMVLKFSAPQSAQNQALFLIDEAAQLKNLELLPKAFAAGRGFGLRTHAVFQDIGQIVENYGPSAVSSFLGSSQVQSWFGVRDYQTAALLSNMLGNTTLEYNDPIKQGEAIKARRNVMNDLLQGNHDPFLAAYDMAHYTRASQHREKMARPLMTPDEIMGMPGNQMLLIAPGLCPPILAERKPYYQAKEMKGCFLPSPFHR